MESAEENASGCDLVHESEENKEHPNKIPCTSNTTEIMEEENTVADEKNKEKKSGRDSHPTVEILCPRVNCTERILFCLDCSSEMNETYFRSRVGDKLSAFRETIKALRMFILNKNRINPSHEFGLAVFTDNTVWLKGFSKPREIINILESLSASLPAGDFDLDSLFQTLQKYLVLPEVVGDIHVVPPPYIVRVIFIYGRSHRVPLFADTKIYHEMEMSPYFFVDVLYVHEPPSEENNCEDIFMRLCELDHKGLSYILEASNLTALFDCAAMLLSHPLQRPVQRQADYHVALPPAVDIHTG